MIFDYLSTVDIYRGFIKINSYIDSVVSNYKNYQLNFRSILKKEFDLICRYMNPHGIVSLILSDNIDTPGQSNLFLSLFKFEEFHYNLRSLSLINLNQDSILLINNYFDMFTNLSSLTILNIISEVPSKLFYIYPKLNRLNIPHDWLFSNKLSLMQLEYLIISNRCKSNEFETIINRCPKLISLNICLERDIRININGLTSNLSRLILNMSLYQINIIELKEILNCFPYLIYFEIECRSDLDLCDGYQWEIFISNKLFYLKKFFFKFQLISTIILNINGIEQILKSYSSYFWLKEKQWFIAIEWGQRLIYSVPKFSCQSADRNFRPPIHTTINNENIFYDNINALALWGETNYKFRYVKELWLVDDPLMINIFDVIDLNKIETLIFVSSNNNLSIDTIFNLISNMKNVNSIQFFDIPLSLIEYKKRTFIIRQIHSIELNKELKSLSFIEILNKIFPEIQRLNMKIKSIEDIRKILNSFSEYLSNVCFYCNTSNILLTREYFEKIIGHTNFTYHIDLNSITLWIGIEYSSNSTESLQRKSIGCFSWCHRRKSLLK
ncbi:unnamed protein product [Rotaria sp. Silwood1]|nr:unnamed protein product [Rotaria sp. Silwood1]CAF1306627.1 unnamed protein product [Rotaria sp. Silwood1]